MSAWIKPQPDQSQPTFTMKDPKFDDSRISNHPDKYLLQKIRQYMHDFTNGKFDAMKVGQSADYTMTDIRKISTSCLICRVGLTMRHNSHWRHSNAP